MNETKPWWQSQTIYGVIIAMLGVVGRLLGYELTEADQHTLVSIVSTLIEGVGAVWAIIGRVRATAVIAKPS